MSMYPPTIVVGHHPPQTVWQSNINGPTIPSCIRITPLTMSCSSSHMLSLPWAVRAVAPFLLQRYCVRGRACGQLQPSTPWG